MHGAVADKISTSTRIIASQCGLALTKWKFVQVVYLDEYGSQFVPNMFGAFYHAYIIGNGSIGSSEILWNSCKGISDFFYTRNGTGGRIRLKSSISTYMDHIEFAIPSEPSTMSILLVMDWHLTCKANTFICIELNIPKFNKLSTCSYLPANLFLVIYCNTVPD